jgi:hypothetical protein
MGGAFFLHRRSREGAKARWFPLEHGEKVHRCKGVAIVSEERQPLLDGICISRASPDPSRDTSFREIESQLVTQRRSR